MEKRPKKKSTRYDPIVMTAVIDRLTRNKMTALSVKKGRSVGELWQEAAENYLKEHGG